MSLAPSTKPGQLHRPRKPTPAAHKPAPPRKNSRTRLHEELARDATRALCGRTHVDFVGPVRLVYGLSAEALRTYIPRLICLPKVHALRETVRA